MERKKCPSEVYTVMSGPSAVLCSMIANCISYLNCLTPSLPNATVLVVELTVHCQTRLRLKFKGTVDSCLFFDRYKGRKSLFFISKCSSDIILSYMEDLRNFLYKNGLYKNVFMSLDFADVKTMKICPRGMTYRTH